MTPTHTGTNMDFQPTGYSRQTRPPLPKAKPCPFCKCDQTMTWHIGHFNKPWIVECYNCSASGPHGCDEKEAIELWNRRAGE